MDVRCRDGQLCWSKNASVLLVRQKLFWSFAEVEALVHEEVNS